MASENPTPHRIQVEWPERSQIIRQTAALCVVIIGWSALFWAAMTIPGSFDQGDGATERRRAAARALPPDSATPVTATAEAESEEAPAEDSTEGATSSIASAGAPPPPAAEPEPAGPAPAEEQTTQVAAAPAEVEESLPQPTNSGSITSDADTPLDEVTLADPLADEIDEEIGEVSFAADVFPILEDRCVKCHGGLRDDGTQRIEEGLSLLTVEDILLGSTWGSVVEPGDVPGSYLYEVVENGDMPDNEPRLLPRELRLIAAWIHQGAPAN